MSNIDYTLWPNADGNLGEIKVQIPDGVTTMWPDGDALIHNFVYQNGKLVGFVDTKALILNESATTTFPYDYVDISLPSIQEGTLTVNRGERCKHLNVKMYRADWLPAGFTELDYLESSGTQCIETKIEVDSSYGAKVEWEISSISNYSNVLSCTNSNSSGGAVINAGSFMLPYWNGVISPFYASFMNNGENIYTLDTQAEIGVRYVSLLNFRNSREVKLNEESLGVIPEDVQSFTCKNPVLFGSSRSGTLFYAARLTGKVFRAQISRGASLEMDLLPALRDSDGVAGMFDRVSKQFFVNSGTGTFGYRIKATGEVVAPDNSTTFSLRDPYYVAPSGVYAKLIAENELEIVADTEEVQGDDWVHFANTGEAYEHFGITFEDATLV